MKIGHFTLPRSLPFSFHIVVVLLIKHKDDGINMCTIVARNVYYEKYSKHGTRQEALIINSVLKKF
jgi:hypothetical protein